MKIHTYYYSRKFIKIFEYRLMILELIKIGLKNASEFSRWILNSRMHYWFCGYNSQIVLDKLHAVQCTSCIVHRCIQQTAPECPCGRKKCIFYLLREGSWCGHSALHTPAGIPSAAFVTAGLCRAECRTGAAAAAGAAEPERG